MDVSEPFFDFQKNASLSGLPVGILESLRDKIEAQTQSWEPHSPLDPEDAIEFERIKIRTNELSAEAEKLDAERKLLGYRIRVKLGMIAINNNVKIENGMVYTQKARQYGLIENEGA